MEYTFDWGHFFEDWGPNPLRLGYVIPTPAEGGEESLAPAKATNETPHGVYPELFGFAQDRPRRRVRSDMAASFHSWWSQWQTGMEDYPFIPFSRGFALPGETEVARHNLPFPFLAADSLD